MINASAPLCLGLFIGELLPSTLILIPMLAAI